MKIYLNLIFALCITVTTISCQTNSGVANKPTPTPTAQKVEVELPLHLNGQSVGSTSNLEPFKTKMKSIYDDRVKNAVLRRGSNEVEMDLFFSSDDRITGSQLVGIGKAYGDYRPLLIFSSAKNPAGKKSSGMGDGGGRGDLRPNPLGLFLTVGDDAKKGAVLLSNAIDSTVGLTFSTVDNEKDAELFRLTRESIELLPDGKILRYDATDMSELMGKDFGDVQPKKREIKAEELGTEMKSLLGSGKPGSILIAPGTTLGEIRKFIDEYAKLGTSGHLYFNVDMSAKK